MAIKHWTVTLIGMSVLVGAIIGPVQSAAASLQVAHPPFVQIIAHHLSVLSVSQGRLTETATYQTTESLTSVLTWYTGRYQLEPGQHKPGQCVILKKAVSHFMFCEHLLATLCPSGTGTRVVLYRDLHLQP